jgi:hypothetical protein
MDSLKSINAPAKAQLGINDFWFQLIIDPNTHSIGPFTRVMTYEDTNFHF